MTDLTTRQLIDKHNQLVASNELDSIYIVRMEIKKRTNSMSWEDGYKHLDLTPNGHLREIKINNKTELISNTMSNTSIEAKEVLKKCKVEGNIVKLPEGQLDRKLYQEVAKALKNIGGQWKGGKVFGFVFKTDPSDLLSQISKGAKINLKKDYQYFATPEKLAIELTDYACVENHHSILEPSAGQGAIVKAINRFLPNKKVMCYELMPTNQEILKQIDTVEFLGEDFLNANGTSEMKFDRIVANPPFTKNQDIDHVKEMYNRLESGGRLVSITSNHWKLSSNKKESAFRDWLENVDAQVEEISKGVFKESGTMVGGSIVIIDRS